MMGVLLDSPRTLGEHSLKGENRFLPSLPGKKRVSGQGGVGLSAAEECEVILTPEGKRTPVREISKKQERVE